MDPLTLTLAGGSALSQIIGDLIKSTDDSKKRKQLQAYLENLGGFNPPDYKFDPEKYKDILGPMGEANQSALGQTAAFRSLQGGGRSGITAELMARTANRGAQNIQNKMGELARTGEQDAWTRALQKYKLDLERGGMLYG